MDLDATLEALDPRHAAALTWFRDNAGTEQPWPKPIAPNTFLVSRAKKIYKPAWSIYALSVRQTLSSPHQDRNPEVSSNGVWTYWYFQENSDPAKKDSEYTNQGLLRCQADGIPIGVMIQIRAKPKIRYHVLGVGHVTERRESYFKIESMTSTLAVGDWNASAMQRAMAEEYDREDRHGAVHRLTDGWFRVLCEELCEKLLRLPGYHTRR